MPYMHYMPYMPYMHYMHYMQALATEERFAAYQAPPARHARAHHGACAAPLGACTAHHGACTAHHGALTAHRGACSAHRGALVVPTAARARPGERRRLGEHAGPLLRQAAAGGAAAAPPADTSRHGAARRVRAGRAHPPRMRLAGRCHALHASHA